MHRRRVRVPIISAIPAFCPDSFGGPPLVL